MTKYNNYAGRGGDSVNKLAILDPTAPMPDPVLGNPVMNEVDHHRCHARPGVFFPAQCGARMVH